MILSSVAAVARSTARQALRTAQPSAAAAYNGALASSSSRVSIAGASRQPWNRVRHYSEQASSAASGSKDADKKASSEESAAEDEDTGAIKKLQEDFEKTDKELARMKDNWRRSVADFENLQKITQREKQRAKDYAIESFAKDIIANMDILHLALRHVPEERRTKATSNSASATAESAEVPEPSAADNLADLYTGVSMTAAQLEKTLNRFNVKSFDPTGEKFNPNMHEALYQAPIPGKEPGTVLECSKKGWMLKDRVLRAAEVGVVASSS